MALAKIKDNRLPGRDYVKVDFRANFYPTVTRKYCKVPIECAYYLESVKHPDFDVMYETGEINYNDHIKQEEEDEKEIERMISPKKEEVKEEKKEEVKVNLDINNDGKFDSEDARLAGKVLAETKKRKGRKK